MNLPLSDDGRTGESVPECQTPAYIRFMPTVWVGEVEPAQVRVPEDAGRAEAGAAEQESR